MKKILWIALFGVIGLYSCEEDPEVTGNPDEIGDSGCKLKTVVEIDEDNETSTWSYTYDNDGNLTKWEDIDEYNNATSIEGYDFTYANGKIVKASYYDLDYPEDVYELDLEWSGNNLVKMSQNYQYEGDTYIYELRFTYANGKPSKIEEWSNDYYNEDTMEEYIGEMYLESETLITFSGNNISKLESKSYQDGTTTLSGIYTETFSGYDDKINPFVGDVAYLIWDFEISSFFSVNNPSSYASQETDYDDSGAVDGEYESNYAISYTYNSDDLPTKINTIETYDGSTYTYSYNLSYDCN